MPGRPPAPLPDTGAAIDATPMDGEALLPAPAAAEAGITAAAAAHGSTPQPALSPEVLEALLQLPQQLLRLTGRIAELEAQLQVG